MLHIITATEQDRFQTRNLVIHLDVDEHIDIEKAVMDACTEYCGTEEGRKVYEGNCNCFNWGDFYFYVPNEICERHGFRKIERNSKYAEKEFVFDQQLVNESELFPDDGDWQTVYDSGMSPKEGDERRNP